MKGQKWMLRILVGMLVVSFLLAAFSLAAVPVVRASSVWSPQPPQPMGCPYNACNCFRQERGWCRVYLRIVDPCWGYEACYYNHKCAEFVGRCP